MILNSYLRGGRDSKTARSSDSREIAVSSRQVEPTRVDVSARQLAATGPNELGATATVEDRLAIALERAATVGQWDVVAQLARELEARRLAACAAADIRARSNRAPLPRRT